MIWGAICSMRIVSFFELFEFTSIYGALRQRYDDVLIEVKIMMLGRALT